MAPKRKVADEVVSNKPSKKSSAKKSKSVPVLNDKTPPAKKSKTAPVVSDKSPAVAKSQPSLQKSAVKTPPAKKSKTAPVVSDKSPVAAKSQPSLEVTATPIPKGGVPPAQLQKAVQALCKFIQAKKGAAGKQALLEESETILLIVSLKKIPENPRTKPIKIPVPHSLMESGGGEVCLLVKDPQRTYKDLLAKKQITSINKVIGVSKLKANYVEYEAKRKLCDSYDLFLADDRILPVLPRLLGKTFFKKKKHPVPVDMSKKDLAKELQTAQNATYLHLGKGPCCAVKVARDDFEQSEIVANLQEAIGAVVGHIPKKWKNVKAMHIKTSDSVALPIYNAP